MPNPIDERRRVQVLRPHPLVVWWRVAFWSAVLVVFAFKLSSEIGPFIVTAIVAAVALRALFRALPGSTELRLYQEGFDLVVAYRSRSYLWRDVAEIRYVWLGKWHNRAGILFAPSVRVSWWRRALRTILRVHMILPENFGTTAPRLIALMDNAATGVHG